MCNASGYEKVHRVETAWMSVAIRDLGLLVENQTAGADS
jgi:hypothetical protein